MNGREEDPRTVYAEIIDLPHWDSPKHPRMGMHERAAQFAPYAALVGYGDLIKEEARETGDRTELSEDEAEEVNRNLGRIADMLALGERPACTISYFVPDGRKAGGRTETATEEVRRIDPVRRRIVLAKKRDSTGAYEEIDLDRIIRIEVSMPAMGTQ